MNYEEALLSPMISWDSLTECIKIPLKLYKYQSFIKMDGTDNTHWMSNMEGQFHMSLGCEFEDINDCKPYFNKNSVIHHLYDSSTLLNGDVGTKLKILVKLVYRLDNNYFDSVASKYQSEIRIGCFTDLNDNEQMWKKYAYDKTGYCIEYDTSKNELFQISTLPVLYSTHFYDCSKTLATLLILECNKQEKKESLENSIKTFELIYRRLLKMVYIPLFIKQKYWEFEREYRMFLLPHRNTRKGLLRASEHLDNNYNLDLTDVISAIYLGENFTRLDNYRELLKQVISICKMKQIRLFRKTVKDGILENVKIL